MLAFLRDHGLWILPLLLIALFGFWRARRARVSLPPPEQPRRRERREVRPDMIGHGDHQRWVFWTPEFVAYSLNQLKQHYETIGWYVKDSQSILNTKDEFVGAVLIFECWDDPEPEVA